MFVDTKCMSKFKRKPLSKVNWRYDIFYNMIHFNNVNFETIEIFSCTKKYTYLLKNQQKSLNTFLIPLTSIYILSRM